MKIKKKYVYQIIGNCNSKCHILSKSKKNDEIRVSKYVPTPWDPIPFSTIGIYTYAQFRMYFRIIK